MRHRRTYEPRLDTFFHPPASENVTKMLVLLGHCVCRPGSRSRTMTSYQLWGGHQQHLRLLQKEIVKFHSHHRQEYMSAYFLARRLSLGYPEADIVVPFTEVDVCHG